MFIYLLVGAENTDYSVLMAHCYSCVVTSEQ